MAIQDLNAPHAPFRFQIGLSHEAVKAKYRGAMTQAVRESIDEASEDVSYQVLDVAYRRCPLSTVDHLHLRDTGKVLKNRGRWAIGFYKDYAFYVHERTDVHHPIGQDHFLSSAIFEAGPKLQARFAQRFEQALRRNA